VPARLTPPPSSFRVLRLQVRSLFPKLTLSQVTNCTMAPAMVTVKLTDGRALTTAASGKTVVDLYEEIAEVTAELQDKEDLAELDKA